MELKFSGCLPGKCAKPLWLLFAVIYLLPGSSFLWGQSSRKPLTITGTLICINPERQEKTCSGEESHWALKARDQKVYRLQAGKMLDTLNKEERLRTREFELTLFEVPGSGEWETTRAFLIREGKRISFSYYCPVCNITASTLMPCPCCQDPMVYREKEIGPTDVTANPVPSRGKEE